MVFWHSVLVAGRFLQMIYDTVYTVQWGNFRVARQKWQILEWFKRSQNKAKNT